MAAKTRHRSKSKKTANKPSAAIRRRTPQAARGTARRAAPVSKPARRDADRHGVTEGMTVATKKTTQRQGFKTNEFIVYPAHGVGQILAIEEQEVAGCKLELFVINFVKDKMTLRVPTAKIAAVGMRKLAEGPIVRRALETLKGRARIKRTMWSRRAQEYEAKINSGNIVAIAEVVRDLYRSDTQPEQSYSERQLYEAALDRLSREISAVQRITETEAIKEIEAALAKGPRRGVKPGDEEAVVEEEAA
ncbi:MAG TPA: CarD family transcriptional regulator [Xanthobacteraceae bacterium]